MLVHFVAYVSDVRLSHDSHRIIPKHIASIVAVLVPMYEELCQLSYWPFAIVRLQYSYWLMERSRSSKFGVYFFCGPWVISVLWGINSMRMYYSLVWPVHARLWSIMVNQAAFVEFIRKDFVEKKRNGSVDPCFAQCNHGVHNSLLFAQHCWHTGCFKEV